MCERYVRGDRAAEPTKQRIAKQGGNRASVFVRREAGHADAVGREGDVDGDRERELRQREMKCVEYLPHHVVSISN